MCLYYFSKILVFIFKNHIFWNQSSTQASFTFTWASAKKHPSLLFVGGGDQIYLVPDGVLIC